jgi:hypothetical protein
MAEKPGGNVLSRPSVRLSNSAAFGIVATAAVDRPLTAHKTGVYF